MITREAQYRYSVFHEDGRRENGGEVVHEVRVVLKQLRSLFLHSGLQTLRIGRGHAVPSLRLSPTRQRKQGDKW